MAKATTTSAVERRPQAMRSGWCSSPSNSDGWEVHKRLERWRERRGDGAATRLKGFQKEMRDGRVGTVGWCDSIGTGSERGTGTGREVGRKMDTETSLGTDEKPGDELIMSNGAVLSMDERGRDGGREPDWGVTEACMEALGPNGNGFVAVKGMNNYSTLRSRLLRLAQKLALMPNLERAAILKEHGLGTDVPLKDPGRPVSSFAAQLRFESPPELEQIGPASSDDCSVVKSSHGDSFSDLGSLFKQLGMCMVEVGLLIARVCDAARSRGSMREARLEKAILDSGTAKGRLVHYHSLLDQEILSSLQKDLRKGYNRIKRARAERNAEISNQGSDSGGFVSTWWQQWHCDYGIFTVLTSPLFLQPLQAVPLEPDNAIEGSCCQKDALIRTGLQLETNLKILDQDSSRLFQQHCDRQHSKGEKEEKPQRTILPQLQSSPSQQMDLTNSTVNECSSPDGHSSLLVMDNHGRITPLIIPSDYLIIQVGEAAQLLTGGELVARPHCVRRPRSGRAVSRETMAVFLQPAWGKRMSLPRGVRKEQALEAGGVAPELATDIPPLASRWKEGCTFGELARETTRQYYGADGWQWRRQPSRGAPAVKHTSETSASGGK